MGHKKLKGFFQMKNSDIFLISAEKTCILEGNKKYTVSSTGSCCTFFVKM